MSAAAMVVALATEGAFGWPDRLYRAIGHPVTWIGRLINHMDLSALTFLKTRRQQKRSMGPHHAG